LEEIGKAVGGQHDQRDNRLMGGKYEMGQATDGELHQHPGGWFRRFVNKEEGKESLGASGPALTE